MTADDLKLVLRRNLEAALRAGRLEEARAVLLRLQDADPLSLPTRALELELHLREDRLAEAHPLARQLLELHPGSPRVHFLAGRLAYRDKRYDEAVEHFREAQRLHPSWQFPWWLGKALTQLGRLDEAEPALQSVVDRHPAVALDLAWLYERRGDGGRALRLLEAHLRDHPADARAEEQRLRLRARAAPPEELADEVETLTELGEAVAPALFGEYLDSLFAQGRAADARRQVAERLAAGLDPRQALRLGWTCYRRQAYDLAYDLFALALPVQPHDVKLLSALEAAAGRAGRSEDLVRLYEQLAPQDRRLYGRIRRLRRSAGEAK